MSETFPMLPIDLPTCSTCGEQYGGSHYHCGRCMDPKPTSMFGHYAKFDDGTSGFTCDEANLGKGWGHVRVTEDRIRPAKGTPSNVASVRPRGGSDAP